MAYSDEDLIELEKVSYAAAIQLAPEMIDQVLFRKDIGFIEDIIVAQIRWSFYSRRIRDAIVEYPADWWEAFKDRFFPRWARRLWPVKKTSILVATHADYLGLKKVNGVTPVVGFTQEIQ